MSLSFDIGNQFLQNQLFFKFQVLPYDQLMQELDVTNVRELEDFLINECMYAVGIIHSLPECLMHLLLKMYIYTIIITVMIIVIAIKELIGREGRGEQ